MNNKITKEQNSKFDLVFLGIGIAAMLTSEPGLLQTTLMATSPEWNKAGNAMPLLMVIILPLAMLALTGFAFGLALAILALIRTNKVSIPDSPSDSNRRRILVRKIIVYSALAVCLAFLTQNLLNNQFEFETRGLSLAAVALLFAATQLSFVGIAGYFAYLTKAVDVYLVSGLVLIPTALFSFNLLSSAIVSLIS